MTLETALSRFQDWRLLMVRRTKTGRGIFVAFCGFLSVVHTFAAQDKVAAASGSPAGVATAENWPMFRGNPGLTGTSPAKVPNKLSVLWSYKTGGPVKSSAAIVGGKVFVGSDDKHLHCI